MKMSSADQKFMMMAATGGMAEVEMARLALEKSSSDAVKQYARKMIDDHTATTEQLTPIAEALGVTPPAETTAAAQLDIAYLETLEGEAFDTAYMAQQRLSHEAAVAAFEIAAETAQDEALRAFATKNLPVIQAHMP